MIDPNDVLAALGVPDAGPATPVKGGEDTLLWRVDTPSGSRALRLMRAEQAPAFEREVTAMRAAAAGVTVPRIEREGMFEGLPAMLMEWCPGRTVMAELQARPWRLWALGRALGEAQARVNALAAPPGLPERWIEWRAIDPGLEAGLRALPRRGRLLHLDFHPLNAMTDGRTVTAVIDWTNTSAGDPRADAARTLTTLLLAPERSGTPLMGAVRRLLAHAWRRGYVAAGGEWGGMALFHAWAGAAMLREWEPRVADPAHWATEEKLSPIRRWTDHWRERAGV